MRRELREWGWMALGFSACLLVTGVGVVMWGNHIEHRIDRVVVERHRDRRALKGIVAALGGAREVQANSKEVQNLEKQGAPASNGAKPAPTGSETATAKPPKSGTGGAVAPGKGGNSGGGGATTGGEPRQEASPAPDQAAREPETDQDEGQEASLAKPAFEDVGSTIEQVGEAVDHALCSVNALGVRVCIE